MIRLAILMAMLLFTSGSLAVDRFEEAMNDYRNGRFDLAYEMLTHLANEGNRDAQFRLGLMYHQGRGAPRNYREAVNWYRKAAEQGHAGAQNNLGVIYRDGEGVRANRVVAYMWFSLSAAQFNSGARRRVDQLETELTVDELTQAQQLTAEHMETLMERKRKEREAELPHQSIYMVQLGLFGDRANVNRIRERLEEAKIPVLEEKVVANGKPFHRLRVGPFARESEAEGVALRVDRLFKIKSLVVAVSQQ